MRTLIILPNTILNAAFEAVKHLNIDLIVIVLDEYYLNESQHIQKLALMHEAIDSFADACDSAGIPSELVISHVKKAREEPYIFEPLDNDMYEKYGYCKMIRNPSALLSREEVTAMPLFTRQSDFYKHMRLRFKVLVDKKKPEGGRWSFDIFNRSKFPKDYKEIHKCCRSPIEDVIKAYPNAYGCSKKLYYPSTFRGAKAYLNHFIKHKLDEFGDYQDAFDSEIMVGNHANISAMMNIGLITPEYVLKKVIESDASLYSVEGFVRQILGWREYMRYVYLRMPNVRKEKYLTRLGSAKVPVQWYTGDTGIPIFDNTIKKVLETGYAHHIERLMILNSAMVMYGFSVDEIHQWFMRMFVDSYEWVMYGCAYMNHNSLAKKDRYMSRVYVSSGNYIRKMSNYRGDSIEVFDALFNKFVTNNANLLSSDYMMASHVTRLRSKK